MRLDANLAIPDGGELLLPIEVPRELIQMDSQGPAKVTRIYSDSTNGSYGVGEIIRVFVEFTGAVQVVGEAPSLLLRTGCHRSDCHTREIQRLRCRATAGKFALAFAGQQVMNIPYDSSRRQLAAYITRMTKIDRVLIQYSIDEDSACTFFGNNITITFESMNFYGNDGDLPSLTADKNNVGGDGTVLEHIRYDSLLSDVAWELQQGQLAPDRRAIFVGNAAPNTLRFDYTVRKGDNSSRLEYVNSDSLAQSLTTSQILNNGTTVPANTKLPPPGSCSNWEKGFGSSLSSNSALTIDVSPPVITNVTSPHDDGVFGIGEDIRINVIFSLPVVVTGNPTVVMETGTVDRILPFYQVLTTDERIVQFQYIVQAKDTTPDLTYTGTTALQLNTGTIKRKSTAPSTDAVLTLPLNGVPGSMSVNKNIVIDTSIPKVVGVTALTSNGLYTAGDTIQLAVTFDAPVAVVGTPQLRLVTGSVNLFPGSFVQVAPMNTSRKTIVFPGVDHGLSTAMSAGVQFKIDQQLLTVASVNGDKVTMLEDYTGRIVNSSYNVANVSIWSPGFRPANYVAGSGTNILTFAYVVQLGDIAPRLDYTSQAALDTNAGSIQRQSTSPSTAADLTLPLPGAIGSLGNNSALVVNTNAPRVIDVRAITRDGVYRAGEEINLKATFDLPVVVERSASILLNLSATDSERYAVYVQGNGTNELIFRYVCRPTDPVVPVVDYSDVKALRPGYGSMLGWIRRKSAVPMVAVVLDLPAGGLSSKGISIDPSCAYVVRVTTTHEDGTVAIGEVVDIQVEFSVPVTVSTVNGVPFLLTTTGSTASFVSGTNSKVVLFRYTVQDTDASVRLNYPDRLALRLDGGEIKAAAGGALATTLLVPPDANGLAGDSAIFVDTSSPIVLSVFSRIKRSTISVGETLVIAVKFNFPIKVQLIQSGTGQPVLMLDVGTGSAVAASLLASDAATVYFTYNVSPGESSSVLSYASRTSLRCMGGYGMNNNPGQGAQNANGRIFQGRLYSIWAEQATSSGKWQVRMKSSDVSRYAPVWRSEDGNGITSAINFNPSADAVTPLLVTVDAKLYAVWQEDSQIRVALFNALTAQWSFVEKFTATATGLNMDSAKPAAFPHAVKHASKLYVGWQELAASGATQIRVTVFNSNDTAPAWTFVDGNQPGIGLNKVASSSARNVRLCSCRAWTSGTTYLFATWEEDEATTNTRQIRVAVQLGPNISPGWKFIDGNGVSGLNIGPAQTGKSPSIACAGGSSLVVAWQETTLSGGVQIRIKVLTGSIASPTWSVIDGGSGLNYDSSQQARNVHIRSRDSATVSTSLFATWEEVDQTTQVTQLRVAYTANAKSGTPWMFLDGGRQLSNLNDDAAHSAAVPKLVLDSTQDRMYIIWQETHNNMYNQIRAIVWSAVVPEWQSLWSTCILRQSSSPTTVASLLLPQKGTVGSLDFTSMIMVDTAVPTVTSIAFTGKSVAATTAAEITQTIDIFNRGSLFNGTYQLQYGDSLPTECIPWDAGASGGSTSIEGSLEAISGIALDVSVVKDAAAFLDGQRYIVTFNFPTVGIKPLKLVLPTSSHCVPLACQQAAKLPCTAESLIKVNEGRLSELHQGIVDIAVQFSAPVVVSSGVPALRLSGPGSRDALYTARSAVQEFDVFVDAASPVLLGGFRLAYGNFSGGSANGPYVTTDCIDVSASDEDAVQDLTSKLASIPAINTIGVLAAARRKRKHGFRYRIMFRNSGDLLDIVPYDSSTCTPTTGRTQTIDIAADLNILAGEVKLQLGDNVSACTPWNLRAQGRKGSMQFVLSDLYGDKRVIPLTVERDPVRSDFGYRYYVNFLMLNDAMKPLVVFRDASCAPFQCDDGSGVNVTCTGLRIAANADSQIVRAVSETVYFQYKVQPLDDFAVLSFGSATALTGNIVRASPSSVPAADLTLPTPYDLQWPKTGATLAIVPMVDTPIVTLVLSSNRDETYTVGDIIVIQVIFSHAVTVKGRPVLELNSKGSAVYASGSNTDQLTFQYRVLEGEAATQLDYVSIYALRSPQTVSSNIQCYKCSDPLSEVALHLPTLASLSTTANIVVNTTQPTILSISSNRPNILTGATGYGIGDIIDIVVEFSTDIFVQGTPSIALNSGGTAVFTRGGFRQVIDIGVDAMQPVTSGQFAVSYDSALSGCISFNNATSLQTQLLKLDGVADIGLVSVTGATKRNGYRFVVVFDHSDILKFPLPLEVSELEICAPLLPSSAGRMATRSTDTHVNFQYVVGENENSLMLDYTGSTIAVDGITSQIFRQSRVPTLIADVHLPPTTLASGAQLMIDGTPITIIGIAADTAPGTYGVGFPSIASPATVLPGEISFRVVFSRAVLVVGTPSIELVTGGVQANGNVIPNRRALFVGQPQPNQAQFLYHIQEGDSSTNLAIASYNALESAVITSVSASSIAVTAKTLPQLTISTGAPILIDTHSIPTTAELSSTHVDGTFGTGEVIDIQVTFSKPVTLLSGLNRNLDWHARDPVALEMNNAIYVMWVEQQSPQTTSESYLYLDVFSSDTLESISLASSSPINRFPRSYIGKVSMVTWRNQLYAAWDENGLILCAVFQGVGASVQWSLIPNVGVNKNIAMIARDAQLVVQNEQLVMIWVENALPLHGSGLVGQVRVAQRNDNNGAVPWIFQDGNNARTGINKNPLMNAKDPAAIVYRSSMYISWAELTAEGTYDIVVAQRYIETGDLSLWRYLTPLASACAEYSFLSSYQPRFAVRRKGIEDHALIISWSRDTLTSNVTEIITGQVLDLDWEASTVGNIPQTARAQGIATSITLNTREQRFVTCGDQVYSSWLEAPDSNDRTSATVVKFAVLNWPADIYGGWSPLGRSDGMNHNPSFDAVNSFLVCSSRNSASPRAGLLWTEYDGYSVKLRFRHELVQQLVLGNVLAAFGEVKLGSPKLKLETNSSPEGYAYSMDYSGMTSYTLSFRYIVEAGHMSAALDCFDGSSFLVNDATIRDELGQTPDFSLFPRTQGPRSLSSNNALVIDSSAPTITLVSSPIASGEYGVGEQLLITVQFSAPVVVIKGKSATTLRLFLLADELHVVREKKSPATYLNGSGSNVLVFNYTVTETDYCQRLDYLDTKSLVLEDTDWFVKRTSTVPTTDADLRLPSPGSVNSLSGNKTIGINPQRPQSLSVTTQALSGVYYPGDSIVIDVVFSLPVVVFGSPVLLLAAGGDGGSQAKLIGGNLTTTLQFKYDVNIGDSATRLDVFDDRQPGSALPYVMTLKLDGGSKIKRKSTSPFTDAILTLPVPGAQGSLSFVKNISIDSVQPSIIEIRSLNLNGTYDVGQPIDIIITFSRSVAVFGAPQIVLNVQGFSKRTAVYVDGSTTAFLRFRYIPVAGDNSWSAPLDILNGKAFILLPIFSERVPLAPPARVLGMSARPTVTADLTLPDPGPALTADAVRSLVGNGTKIFVRTDGFRVVTVQATIPNGIYSPGELINLNLTFTDIVVVQGVPTIKLNVNAATTRYASYTNGSGTPQLKFKYAVQAGDSCDVLEAASTAALELNEGSITDINGVNVPLQLPQPLVPGSLSFESKIGISSVPPIVQQVFSINSDGKYGVGDDLQIAVRFSRRVSLANNTVASLALQLSSSPRTASYTSGSGSTTLMFSISLAAGDSAVRLDYTSQNALAGSFLATAATPILASNPSLPVPGENGSLSVSSSIQVVSTVPRVEELQVETRNGTYGLGDTLLVRVKMSYPVVVASSPLSSCTLKLYVSSSDARAAVYSGGSTTQALTFAYTVQRGDRTPRLDYIDQRSLVCLLKQFTAHPTLVAVNTLPLPGSIGSIGYSSAIRVDDSAPRVVLVSSTLSNGVYGVGQVISIQVVFSEAVLIQKCVPRLRLAIGAPAVSVGITSGPRSARYEGGSGTNVLSFLYMTQEGDMALPLEYADADALTLESVDGSIVAAAAGQGSYRVAALRLPPPLSSGSLSNNKDIRIDTSEPPRVVSVSSVTPNGVYTAGDTVTISVTFTVPVVVTGTPTLALEVINPDTTDDQKAAMYVSGSGTTSISFRYVIRQGDRAERLDYRSCPLADRSKPVVRKWSHNVVCSHDSNALRTGVGGTIKRQATVPTTDAILDLPEANAWSKVRVETGRGEFVYVNQEELGTGEVEITNTAVSMSQFGIVQKRSSAYIYSDGVPNHETSLLDTNVAQRQQYFIVLERFPSREPAPLYYRSTSTSFLGIFLNGVPFRATYEGEAVRGVDKCGGAVDSLGRYFYQSIPTCFLTLMNEPQDTSGAASDEQTGSNPPSFMLGYAFDGYPVYGFYDEDGHLPKLDECHGRIRKDGQYCYHLLPLANGIASPFMPCLKGIDASNNGSLSVFRFPADIASVEGLSLQELTQFDGFVVDSNPDELLTEALWSNPESVSVVYTSTSVVVRSTGVPGGEYGPFPNAYNRFAIEPQDYVFTFPRFPIVSSTTTELPRDTAVGVMLNGVPFYSSYSDIYGNVTDTSGPVYKLLDKCNGFVDGGGKYRYYGSPDCLIDELGGEQHLSPSPLVGYAFDGFAVYGLFTEDGELPTDLDECGGRFGDDGIYRYHITMRSPYLIGCYRGTPSSGLAPSADNMLHSLSYGHAIGINTVIPRITQIFTNKRPGIFVSGETIDLVVQWSTPVIVDTTGGLPSIQIENTTSVAVYNSTRSSSQHTVFIFTVAKVAGEFSHRSRSKIQLNGSTIRRFAASPQLDADVNLANAEHNSRFLSKYQLVKSLEVVLRGLYHPRANDLTARILHGTVNASIFERCCASRDVFGVPDAPVRVNTEQLQNYPANPTSGVGWDYRFRDFVGQNVALAGQAVAVQSSTSGRCYAANAIDGQTSGRVSSQSVARTAATSQNAWWEVRLIKPINIGTIRVWMAADEELPALVVGVRVDSAGGVAAVSGNFTLLFTSASGQQSETSRISYNAPAMIVDENPRVSTPGIGLGESMQAKLAALSGMPRVFVTRSPADAALSTNGAFAWSITFLDDPSVSSLNITLSVGKNRICNGTGKVQLIQPYPGDDRDDFVYSDDDIQDDSVTIGEMPMFPFWIMLFEASATMAFETFDDAYSNAIWIHKVDASATNRRVVSVTPPPGTTAQYVRIVADNPFTYLTLAEVEVFIEQCHLLSDYRSGSPVSPVFYPGAQAWSPEEPFGQVFGSMASEGTWILAVTDAVRLDSMDMTATGGISDWVLRVTSFGGETRTYYMDMKAHVQTLPRHGTLYVTINETERDHVDFDGNGVLDSLEADAFLRRYSIGYDMLPHGMRSRALVSFLSGYDSFGGIAILSDASEREKVMPSLCDRECYESQGVDPYMYTGTRGDVGLKLLVVDGDRIVRYVPKPGFRGVDAFTFAIMIGTQTSNVLGTVQFAVQNCRDADCTMESSLVHRSTG